MTKNLQETMLAKDGLAARPSGEWAKRKHHFLKNYCAITTQGMKNHWSKLVYIDAMAGPGLCRIKKTGEEIPGSPLIALDHQFTDYIFAEAEPELAEALRQRVTKHSRGKVDYVRTQDWTQLALEGKLSFQRALVVAFVDPTGISQVPWKALEQLLKSNRKIDLLMTLQHGMGIRLNANNYVDSNADNTALSEFLGETDWKQWKFTSPTDFTDKVVDRFLKKVQSLGFQFIQQELVKADNLPLYRFIYASRHPRGEDFWKKITRWDEKGQKEFSL